MDRPNAVQNMNKIPLQDLKPYFGYNIARSADGAEILAHHLDLIELFTELTRRGITDYIIEYLPPSSAFDEPVGVSETSGGELTNGSAGARR